jgi:hypothetical protein
VSHKIFEARYYDEKGTYTAKEFALAQPATGLIESIGEGSVTLFLEEPNQPGRLPDTVQRSLAHWRYQDGKWQAISIHTGCATSMGEEKPHL